MKHAIFVMVAAMLLAFTAACDNSVRYTPQDDTPDGDMPDGDIPDGDTVPNGEIPDDDLPDGDKTDPDASDGDKPDGDLSDGDKPDGDLDDDSELDEPSCSGCLIDSACIPAGQDHPDSLCAYCNPDENTADWTPRPSDTECRAAASICDAAEVCDGVNLLCPTDGFVADGTLCNDDGDACNGLSTCTSGSCEQSAAPVVCTALDECHVAGVCDTATGVCSNPNVDDGSACGTAQLNQCVGGLCEDCFDVSGCTDFSEDDNPCTSLACVANACTERNDNEAACDLGHDCTTDHCIDGMCTVETITAGCLIEGKCVAAGISQDADGCIACDPPRNQRDWSNMDGVACAVSDDGNPCTDDVCSSGRCVAIDNNTNSCENASTCTETTCLDGECLVIGTTSGCYIDNACHPEGARETPTGNGSCRICESLSAWNAWTPQTSGTCDDGNACTHSDTCGVWGACAGTLYQCNDHGSCNPYNDGCTCATGYAGDYCDECARAFYGYPDCQFDPTLGFALVTAGSFWMGSPDGACPEGYPGSCTIELGRDNDETLHNVELTYDFEMMTTEVLQGQWRAQAQTEGWGENPSFYSACGDDCPVELVNWFETLEFANAMSRNAGLPECYILSGCMGTIGSGCEDNYFCYEGFRCASVTLNGISKPQQCEGYRLPTEAEWEYAIRTGTTTALYNGELTQQRRTPLDPNLNEIGWYGGNSGVLYSSGLDCTEWYPGSTTCGTHPAASKSPNAWGLYDMSGNVYEWTWDWYQEDYQNDAVADPFGPSLGPGRIMRGGACSSSAAPCRSAGRGYSRADYHYSGIGFRLVRSRF